MELDATARRGFSPSFQRADSKLYRLEYGFLTLSVLGYLIWRAQNLGGVDIIQTVGWILFPDVVAFVPIGLSSSRQAWPPWGVHLYNLFHNLLLWGLVFALAWIFLQTPYWPLFGWLGHITADRALGYGLRDTRRQ